MAANDETQGDKMSTLTLRIMESQKASLSDAAKRIGFVRQTEGELTGNTSALIVQLARALPNKTEAEIKAFLYGTKAG